MFTSSFNWCVKEIFSQNQLYSPHLELNCIIFLYCMLVHLIKSFFSLHHSITILQQSCKFYVDLIFI